MPIATMDADLTGRVKRLLASPGSEWPRIASEARAPREIVLGYLVWLAAIPAVAGFVGWSLIGFRIGGMTVRTPLLAGLAGIAVGIGMTLVLCWMLSLIVARLAPRFGGRDDPRAAFRLVAYGGTAALVAGVVNVLPMLASLGLLGALYTLYLVHRGLPVLLDVPPARAPTFTAVIAVCAMLLGLLVGTVGAMLSPSVKVATSDTPSLVREVHGVDPTSPAATTAPATAG